jgi:hypothetical protein
MREPLFGELLGRYAPLSGHDVAEILEDQANSHRRFGEIALAYGLCEPRDVWKAWWEQISDSPPRIDLNVLGIDAQAIERLPARIARQFNVLPLRITGNQMVMAASDSSFPIAARQLPDKLKLRIKFVLVDEMQLKAAMQTCYPRNS